MATLASLTNELGTSGIIMLLVALAFMGIAGAIFLYDARNKN